MMGCEYFQELISCLIDGELSRDEEAQLADHLEICPECAAMYRAFKDLSCIIEQDMADAPESLCPNVMAELRRAEIIKKNRRKSALKAVLATAACAVLVFAAGRLTGMGGSSDANTTIAVYDVKMAKSESFAVPAEAPAAAAPQMMEDGAAVTGGTMVTEDITAAEPEAMMEEFAEEAAPMQTNTFSLTRADDADAGTGSTEPVEWSELAAILDGEPAPEGVQLPESPALNLTVFHEGVYYSLSFYELDGNIFYLDPLNGVWKQSSASLEELTIS